MREAVVVRNVETGQQLRDAARERAGAGKQDAEPCACRVGEEVQRFLDDRAGLPRGVFADEKFDGAHGLCGAFRDFRRRLRNAQCVLEWAWCVAGWERFGGGEFVLPRADPCRVDVLALRARIAQANGRVSGGVNGRGEQRPQRPVRTVEAGDEDGSKGRRSLWSGGEELAVEVVEQIETAVAQLPIERLHDGLQRQRSGFAKFPTASAEQVDRFQQVIRCCSRRAGRVAVIVLGGCGEEQAQVFAERERVCESKRVPQMSAHFERRHEMQAEQVQARLQCRGL